MFMMLNKVNAHKETVDIFNLSKDWKTFINTKVPGSIPVPRRKFQGLNFFGSRHHLWVWSWGNDDSPSEGEDKRLTRVKREPYLLHVKDTLVDFEKEQANAATRLFAPAKWKGINRSCNNLFPNPL